MDVSFQIRQYRVLSSEGDALDPEVSVTHEMQADLGEGI